MPWPTKSRTTLHPSPSTYSWMAPPMSPRRAPSRTCAMPDVERAPRDLDDVARLGARRADVERGARVAVEPLVDVRHVDVDDVAVLEDRAVRNPVADDVVDARADALGKALVVERRRARALPERVLVDDAVDVVPWSSPTRIFSPTRTSVSAASRQTVRISSIFLGLLMSIATRSPQGLNHARRTPGARPSIAC